MQTVADMRGVGVKNREKFADVLCGRPLTPKIEGEEAYGADTANQQVLSSWLTCREKVSFLDKTLLFLYHNPSKVFLK